MQWNDDDLHWLILLVQCGMGECMSAMGLNTAMQLSLVRSRRPWRHVVVGPEERSVEGWGGAADHRYEVADERSRRDDADE
jgi:hypothetical protein